MRPYNGFTTAERQKAVDWLEAKGLPKPKRCQCCLQTSGPISRHTEDYSEPYDDNIGEYAVCYICHMMIHCRQHSPEKWEEYKTLVQQGFTWEHYGSSWPRFRKRFLTGSMDDQCAKGEPPEKNWLRIIEEHGERVKRRLKPPELQPSSVSL